MRRPSSFRIEDESPAIISDHPYQPPAEMHRYLCAVCQLAEAAHAATERPYVPEGARRC